ncbi:carboxymuconolactone decarboxylase family protein [Marinobacter lutaoensis]|uniref:carboxymuconolactone decarboxylase family protein n=1 Tax=Marinobacter lutaoensis TaxID=135739 RepID=UPI0011156A04
MISTASWLRCRHCAEPQLRAHIRMATNVGVTEQQLRDVAQVLAAIVGKIEAQRVEQAIEAVLHPQGNAG